MVVKGMNQVVSTYLAIKSKLFQNQHLQSELNTSLIYLSMKQNNDEYIFMKTEDR